MSATVHRILLGLVLLAGAALAAGEARAAEYWVQIAATNSRESADARLSEIVRRNTVVRAAQEAGRITVYRHTGKRGDFWRVRIGPFADHEQARQYCLKLRADGLSCIPAS